MITFPKELRERIVVVAIAPGAYIDKHLCKSVIHLVSKFDAVPKIDAARRLRCRDTIQSIKGDGIMADHTFTNPIYERLLQEHFKDFREGQT